MNTSVHWARLTAWKGELIGDTWAAKILASFIMCFPLGLKPQHTYSYKLGWRCDIVATPRLPWIFKIYHYTESLRHSHCNHIGMFKSAWKVNLIGNIEALYSCTDLSQKKKFPKFLNHAISKQLCGRWSQGKRIPCAQILFCKHNNNNNKNAPWRN